MATPASPSPTDRRHRLWAGGLVFATALVLRLLFWQATPDAAWAGSARYVGDASLWVEHARALVAGRPFELGLPLRPPGNAWLLMPWVDRGGLGVAGVVWCLLGALVAWLAFRAALRPFGFGPALATGMLCAGSTALMTLSTSLNNETPYLAVAVASLWVTDALVRHPGAGRAGLWGLLGAAGCLLRVEHALFVVLAAGWFLLLIRRRPDLRRRWRALAVAAAAGFLLPLVPWHLAAWNRLHAMNTVPPTSGPESAQIALERQLAPHVHWTSQAAAVRDGWPAFARRTAANFVAATVLYRGRHEVTAEDLRILEDGLGAAPEPLDEHPFVALYGGLNFYLANHAGAEGGFSRGPLDAAPPLAGGVATYPPLVVAGLPPEELALAYPPHVAIVNHGWRLGLDWMRRHPADAAALGAEKLRRFWAGASLGLGGRDLPLGEAGVRWPVDLAVPQAEGARGVELTLWRLALLAAAVAGAFVGRPRQALVPWLLWLGSKVVAASLFFGYARLGATVVPVLALLVSLAVARLLPTVSARRALTVATVAAALLLTVETARWLSPPALQLDGHAVTATGPFPPDDPDLRQLTPASPPPR